MVFALDEANIRENAGQGPDYRPVRTGFSYNDDPGTRTQVKSSPENKHKPLKNS